MDFADALGALDAGRPIVIPTDTVYGIAARPELPDAIARIFSLKGRAEEKALPILGAGLDDLRRIAEVDGRAEALARRFWPGPLTLVVPRARGFTCSLGSVDDGSVAVRVPAHPVALELLERSGPLAVTSANLSGQPAAATVQDARESLARGVDVFLDGGAVGGAPSTVVGLMADLEILRQGALISEEIFAAAG